MHTKIGVLLLMLLSAIIAETKIVKIDQIRGTYQINFDDVFEIPIYPDIETMIVIPKGYTVTLVVPGSTDFVSASLVQNTIYISRPVDHIVDETNVTVHIVTPDGTEKKLVIRCVGPKKGKKVLAVQFEKQNVSEVNRIVENMKARYTEQLTAELHQQEKELQNNVHDKTIAHARYMFIDATRKARKKEYKGATVYLDGIINSQENSYIYLISTASIGPNDIISLDKVFTGSLRANPVHLSTYQLSKNEYYSCWMIPRITVPENKSKIELLIKIWSKEHKISARIS